MSSQQSIYRIPSLLKELHPNAYEPRVVSIGPYHYGKPQLQAMEEQKDRALNRFRSRNGGISLDDILHEFKREPNFLEEVRNCYTEPLEPNKWSDNDVFSRLMVLDGCFLLELLLGNYPITKPTSSINDRPEKHALLSYVKMDMLVLDNQIPLLVLRKLASIVNSPTGSEDVAVQVDKSNITALIWKFYGTMNDKIPADLDDAHHVLDAYWKKGCNGTGPYDGWASRESADELYYRGVEFQPCSGEGVAEGFVAMGNFKDVAFKVSDDMVIKLFDDLLVNLELPTSDQSQNGQAQQNHQNNIFIRLHDRIFYYAFRRQAEPSDQSQNGQAQQNHQICYSQILTLFLRSRIGRSLHVILDCLLRPFLFIIRLYIRLILIIAFWWWYIPFVAAKGMFSLPRLTIDGTTRPTLLNLMAFERLHLRYEETHPVTDYVSLMASLIRSENDAELLRRESILLCWTNESVVQLFADLTRNVLFNGTRKTNPKIDVLCKRQSKRPYISEWRRGFRTQTTATSVAVLTLYSVFISLVNTIFTIAKYLDDRKHRTVVTKTNL